MATILVVDDRPTNREFLVTLLSYAKHQVLEAENGTQAIELCLHDRPDLIITDILMPTMDGYQLVLELKADPGLAGIPVIFYTATYLPGEARSLAEAVGVQHVLTKPTEPQTILATVHAALGLNDPQNLQTEIVTHPPLDPVLVVSSRLSSLMSEMGDMDRRLEALIELILKLASEREPQRLLEIACEAARAIVGATYAAIGMIEENDHTLKYFVTSGMDAETVAGIEHPPLGKGVLGKLLSEGLPLRLRDLTTDPTAVGFPPGHPVMKSFLGIPLASPSGLYGRLYLTDKIGADEFSERDEYLAVALGAQVSVAFENAHRYNIIQRHAAGLQIEVVERKRAEEELRHAHERIRRLVDSNVIGIVIATPEGKVIEANDYYLKMIGYTRQEFEQGLVDWRAITPPEWLSTDEQAIAELRERGICTPYEKEYIRRDGTRVAVFLSDVMLPGAEEHIAAFALDITERKQAEKQIQRQLQQLNGLRMIDIAISSSFDLHVVLEVVLQQVMAQLQVDASTVLLFDPVSQTLEYAAGMGFPAQARQQTRLMIGEGYAIQAVLTRKMVHVQDGPERGGKLADILYGSTESFAEYYAVPLMIKGEVKGVLEIYQRSPNQADAAWLDFLGILAGQIAIAIDNAQLFERLQGANAELEQRVAERTAQLNQTNAELEQANRAKDEFLASMSHELRTPLNSILGLSESLLEERRGKLNEHQKNSLEIIRSSGAHLLELINDILDLSKIEAGMFDYFPQEISVEDFCRSCLSFIKAQALKKSITITYLKDASITSVFADPRRLKQILVNLLSNAVKFTHENGHVTLKVSADPERELIRFSVIDDGIGIGPESLSKLFQPFIQVDSSLNRQYQGTGLGLALVRKLVELHGGSVEVESELGKGSSFTVNLAYPPHSTSGHDDSSFQVLASHEQDAGEVGRSIHTKPPGDIILLAEDNQANILTISEYLESHGFRVVVAYDGQEALEKAETHLPALILMDIQMPVMDGLEAITRLRQKDKFAFTPIIALTALAMPGDRDRCLAAGANEYISKPVSLRLLISTIRRFLG